MAQLYAYTYVLPYKAPKTAPYVARWAISLPDAHEHRAWNYYYSNNLSFTDLEGKVSEGRHQLNIIRLDGKREPFVVGGAKPRICDWPSDHAVVEANEVMLDGIFTFTLKVGMIPYDPPVMHQPIKYGCPTTALAPIGFYGGAEEAKLVDAINTFVESRGLESPTSARSPPRCEGKAEEKPKAEPKNSGDESDGEEVVDVPMAGHPAATSLPQAKTPAS